MRFSENRKMICSGLAVMGAALVFLFWPLSREFNPQAGLSLRIYDANGVLLREVLNQRQELAYWAGLHQVAPEMKEAMIAAEDKRFYRHPGVDPLALTRSLIINLKHRRIVSGGSPITQQLVRQVYSLPRRWYVKPWEMALAVRMECQLSKSEILEQYLNRMPFANQIYGVETASRRYFNKPASQLSLSEACLLAGLPQAPSRYNPYRRLDLAQKRQRMVLQRLLASGRIDSSRYAMALSTSLHINEYRLNFHAPHFCQHLLNMLPAEYPKELHTTLDVPVQNLVEELVAGHLTTLRDQHVSQAAVLVVENAARRVKAYVGSADFFNADIHGQVDGVTSLRQPGSAIKPFTYGLALENGYTAASILADVQTFAPSAMGDFAVHNYDEKFHGPVRLRTALACSYNVPAVRLLESLGADLLLQRLHSAGIASLDRPAAFYGHGLTLGNGDITLLELTRAFTALANQGRYSDLVFLSDQQAQPFQPIFSAQIAWLLSDILSDAQARAPAFGWAGPLRLPFPCAAKTGTTKDFRDNWTIGYTQEYTVGVWVGNFDGTPMRRISGITGAAPLFRDVMLALHRRADPPPFARPAGLVETVICSRSGQLAGPDCPGHAVEYFLAGSEPRESCTVHRAFYFDRRNDQLADAHTPPAMRQRRILEVWPAEFAGWMAENNLAAPPEPLSPAIEERSHWLAVSFPDEGDVFRIDPVLKREFQTLMCTAIAPGHIHSMEWLVDGQLVATVPRPFNYQWPLARGKHRLAVQIHDRGTVRRSEEVEILVF